MTSMVMTLPTPESVPQVAAFFASLPAPTIKDIEKRGDNVIISDPARKLVYQRGWDRNIPACATCHGHYSAAINSNILRHILRR